MSNLEHFSVLVELLMIRNGVSEFCSEPNSFLSAVEINDIIDYLCTE